MKLTEFVDKVDRTKAMELLEYLEETDDEMRLGIAELLMDGHLCELTATAKVEKMKAPVLMSAPDKVWTTDDKYQMCTYMSAVGLTPKYCKELVEKAHERAVEFASKLGVSAPHLPHDMNMWDAYYNMAMVLSDYWYSINGDMNKAAMMAYEVISDIDRGR